MAGIIIMHLAESNGGLLPLWVKSLAGQAQLYQGYQVTDPDRHGHKPLRKIWVHSALACTRHGDECRIANSGDEPCMWLCSITGPALWIMMMRLRPRSFPVSAPVSTMGVPLHAAGVILAICHIYLPFVSRNEYPVYVPLRTWHFLPFTCHIEIFYCSCCCLLISDSLIVLYPADACRSWVFNVRPVYSLHKLLRIVLELTMQSAIPGLASLVMLRIW